MIKVGFGKGEITPPMGAILQGYYDPRYADGILDNLYATAVAFDNGEKRAVVISCDIVGMNQVFMARVRGAIADACKIPSEAVFVHCTHIHTGPGVAASTKTAVNTDNAEYGEWLISRLADIAGFAFCDLAPSEMLCTRARVEDVAFVRRFRMRDGSVLTNPGRQNPDIDHALSEPDEEAQLLIIKREGKPEIGIVNFQVHPDVVSGSKVSADYPGFVRETYESLIENSLCMYINGTQGDTNHIDVRLTREQNQGYHWSRHMGRKIAMAVAANYERAVPITGDEIAYGEKIISVKHNKGTEEELAKAEKLIKVYNEVGVDGALPDVQPLMHRVELIAEATRIVTMSTAPDEKELVLSAVAVGDVVFASFPGEPFTDVGRGVKRGSKFSLTIPACCANGYEGYYPMASAFEEGGYEALSAKYVKGTAEKLIETSLEIINNL